MVCSYVLKKEIPKNTINHQSYGRCKKLSNFIIILDISISTNFASIETCQQYSEPWNYFLKPLSCTNEECP